MSAPLWATELADAFWADAGDPGPFPRDLRRPIAAALPVTVVDRPRLTVVGVVAWLERQGVAARVDEPDRPLRACLAAVAGVGVIFLDAADPADERRFSLGHELAHYLRDYWGPRRRASNLLGPAVLEVFDGRRPSSSEERLHALLRGVRVWFHTHLLARDTDPQAAVTAAERDADRLAYELLAPAAAVRTGGGDLPDRLRSEFGLPPAHAARYAALLYPPPPPALADRLRAAKIVSNSDRPGGN